MCVNQQINTLGIGSINYSCIPVNFKFGSASSYSSPLLVLANVEVEVGRVRGESGQS
jgi:hypothetical protein